MTKKSYLIFSIVLVGVIIVAMIGTSLAYFSDSEMSTTNNVVGGNWTNPSWYNFLWYYRVPITVTNNGTAVSNYQLKMTVNYVTGDSWKPTKMNSDFSDLIFIDSTGTNAIPYWVESYTASTSAVVWVKIPSIAATGTNTTIYMYYGNPAATTASSGSSTFAFFDDFDNGTSQWTLNAGTGTTAGVDATTGYSGSNS